MNTYIRLSDNLEMTEQDIDPLCTIPNINFNPDPSLYSKVRQSAKPSVGILKEVVKAPTALVDDIWTQQWEVVDKYRDYTDSDGVVVTKAEQEAAAVAGDTATKDKEAKELSKRTGIEILGVMCSATKEDQMGLTAVGLDYSMTTAGGGTFASTKFEFANGNTLAITADNFSTIYNLWVPFRRSFFTPD